MSQLIAEIALRLLKAAAAALVGFVIYLVATAVFGASPSVELGLMSWLSGAVFVLLVESSPI